MCFVSVDALLLEGQLWVADPLRGSSSEDQSPLSRTKSEQSSGCYASGPGSLFSVPFGVRTIDRVLPDGGLPAGKIHEFYSTDETLFPATVSAALAGNALRATEASTSSSGSQDNARSASLQRSGKLVLWIGRECWPTPYLLEHALQSVAVRSNDAQQSLHDQFSHAVFLNPPSPRLRLWAVELALRSPAVAAVIAPLTQLSFATTRKLALAAREGGGLGIIVRPYTEIAQRSAAWSKWRMQPAPTEGSDPRWQLSLCRLRNREMEKVEWLIESRYEEGKALSLHLLPSMVSRSSTPSENSTVKFGT